jgi:hypothetical protein
VLWLATRRRLAVVSPHAPAPWAPTARPDQAPLVGERDGLHPVA